MHQGFVSIERHCLTSMEFPLDSHDCLIFIMGILTPKENVFILKKAQAISSPLVQVMDRSCLMPNHYMNQCWRIIKWSYFIKLNWICPTLPAHRSVMGSMTSFISYLKKKMALKCKIQKQLIYISLADHCGLVMPYGIGGLSQHWFR